MFRAGIGFVSLRRCVLARKRSPAYFRPPLVLVAPFSQGSFPYCAYNKKTRLTASFFVIGTRAGI